jgi:hypothetical protein
MRKIIIVAAEVCAVLIAAFCAAGGAQAATEKTYKIGGTGPAGGIVFYDRGFAGKGWRYLEAAPSGSEFNAEWGAYQKDAPNTMTAVGFGKKNTKLIVERLQALGETDKAAQLCAALDVKGYKDWFLPSKDELDLMHKNLKQKGLGEFSNTPYWSSSQYDDDANVAAWGQEFISGYQDWFFKDYNYAVRAIRAF